MFAIGQTRYEQQQHKHRETRDPCNHVIIIRESAKDHYDHVRDERHQVHDHVYEIFHLEFRIDLHECHR